MRLVQRGLYRGFLLPLRIVRQSRKHGQHERLTIAIAAIQDFDNFVDEFRIGGGGRVQIQHLRWPSS